MSIPAVFKPARKGDRPRCVYLYPDGHVVATFERFELGHCIRYVKIAESVGVTMTGLPLGRGDREGKAIGRIIFHSAAPLVAAVLLGGHITVFPDNASPKAKEMGIRVATVYISSRYGDMSLDNVNVHASDVTIQTADDDFEEFSDVEKASKLYELPVVAIYPNKPERTR